MTGRNNLDYGVIGNCRSAALISANGCVDWCCLADFDSPSVFAALLDQERGGRFSITSAAAEARTSQSYLRHTNILKTLCSAPDGDFEILDFMPRYYDETGGLHCLPDLIRMVRPLRGKPRIRVQFDPRLGYAQYPTLLVEHPNYVKAETTLGAHESVYLYANIPLVATSEIQEVALAGEVFLWLSYNQKIGLVDIDRAELEYERTKVYWLNWCARTAAPRHYSQVVKRSALVLKLLSFQETGAILAAATTSLPETIGEERNWDYRFCWIRDASMTIRTLVTLGHVKVAQKFFEFLLDIVPYKNDRIQIMYGIRGQRELEETQLDWLSGYEGSKPVRIGNAAWFQQQNDIYGVLLDVIYHGIVLFPGSSVEIEALWTMARGVVRHIEVHWRQPDQGIWEIRGEPRHFTHSKVMCWVGVDRALKLAQRLGFSDVSERWSALRDEICQDILRQAWSEERGAFTQSYGSKHLDAANLLMWRMGFIDASDRRWVSTVRATYAELCRDGLMYRYRNDDDFGAPKSAFTVCSFWMIQALVSIGDVLLARSMFDDLLQMSNHVGLFSEDLDFETHRLLGNFPQGYSHLAVVDTALLLDAAPTTSREQE